MFTVWQTFSTDELAPPDQMRYLAQFDDETTARSFAFNAYEILAPRQAYWMETSVVVIAGNTTADGYPDFVADIFDGLTLADLIRS